MKTKIRAGSRLTAWLGMLGAAALIAMLLPADDAGAQTIRNTKHDLSSGSTGGLAFSGTAEVCVFCHTPHGAATGTAPLWNKTLPSAAYQVYSTTVSSTMDAPLATDGIAASPSVGSVSIGCLSCHDGSLAMNSVINAPGSGLTNAAFTAGTWTPALPGGRMAAGVANLGLDLRNDHPIGMHYCGGGPTVAAPGTACVDPDFRAPLNAAIGGTTVFWVETGGNTTRHKTDMILYNRVFAGGAAPAVECGSCHDPHTNANTTFLRLSNAASALCLSCHVK